MLDCSREAKAMQKNPGKAVPVPPVYKPGAARTVLQAKPALPGTGQPKVKVPPAFVPPRQSLVQAKPVTPAFPVGELIQRAERKTNNTKQEKIKAAQLHKKKEKQRQDDKTRRNATGYGGFTDTEMVNAFISEGGVVKGHLSQDSNAKASGHTTSSLQKLREFSANYHGSSSSEEGDAAPVRVPKVKEVAPTTAEDLEGDAIKAWNKAVDDNKDGLVAMREYLAKRRLYSPGVTDGMVEEILEAWGECPADQKLLVS